MTKESDFNDLVNQIFDRDSSGQLVCGTISSPKFKSDVDFSNLKVLQDWMSTIEGRAIVSPLMTESGFPRSVSVLSLSQIVDKKVFSIELNDRVSDVFKMDSDGHVLLDGRSPQFKDDLDFSEIKELNNWMTKNSVLVSQRDMISSEMSKIGFPGAFAWPLKEMLSNIMSMEASFKSLVMDVLEMDSDGLVRLDSGSPQLKAGFDLSDLRALDKFLNDNTASDGARNLVSSLMAEIGFSPDFSESSFKTMISETKSILDEPQNQLNYLVNQIFDRDSSGKLVCGTISSPKFKSDVDLSHLKVLQDWMSTVEGRAIVSPLMTESGFPRSIYAWSLREIVDKKVLSIELNDRVSDVFKMDVDGHVVLDGKSPQFKENLDFYDIKELNNWMTKNSVLVSQRDMISSEMSKIGFPGAFAWQLKEMLSNIMSMEASFKSLVMDVLEMDSDGLVRLDSGSPQLKVGFDLSDLRALDKFLNDNTATDGARNLVSSLMAEIGFSPDFSELSFKTMLTEAMSVGDSENVTLIETEHIGDVVETLNQAPPLTSVGVPAKEPGDLSFIGEGLVEDFKMDSANVLTAAADVMQSEFATKPGKEPGDLSFIGQGLVEDFKMDSANVLTAGADVMQSEFATKPGKEPGDLSLIAQGLLEDFKMDSANALTAGADVMQSELATKSVPVFDASASMVTPETVIATELFSQLYAKNDIVLDQTGSFDEEVIYTKEAIQQKLTDSAPTQPQSNDEARMDGIVFPIQPEDPMNPGHTD